MKKSVNTYCVMFGMLLVLTTMTGCIMETGVETQEGELTSTAEPSTFSDELAVWEEDDIVTYPGDAGVDDGETDTSVPVFTGSVDFDERPAELGVVEFVRPCECNFQVSENNGLICMRLVCEDSCSERVKQCAALFGGCTLQRY